MKKIVSLVLTVMILLTSAFAITAWASETFYHYVGESVLDISEQYTADKRNKKDIVIQPLVGCTFTAASGEVFTSEVSKYVLGVVKGSSWHCEIFWHVYNEDKSIDITAMVYSYTLGSTLSDLENSEFYFEPWLSGETSVHEDGSIDLYYESAYIRDKKTNRVCAEICFDKPMVQTVIYKDGVQVDISEYSVFEFYRLSSTIVLLRAHPNQNVFGCKIFMVERD